MSPDDFKRLVAAGLSTDQIAIVMEIMAAGDEDRKAKQRARWRKHQENKKNTNVSKRELTLANVPREGVTRVEDKPLPTEIEPQEQEGRKKRAPDGDAAAFRAALSPFLDTERLDAIVKHRRTKRAQVSAHAAGLFLRAAESAGLSVAEAVDTCIERGWLTVKADWLAPKGRAGPASRAPSQADVFAFAGRRLSDDPRPEPEDRSGFRAAIPHLRPVASG